MHVHLLYFIAVFTNAGLVFPSELQQTTQTATGSLTNGTVKNVTRGRRKRFDYEDTYEWKDDDDLTYEGYYEEEEAEPNLFQKIAQRWRTAGPRVVFLGAFLILITLIFCSCLRLACRFWCKSLEETCSCCCMPGVKQTCQMCYTDPMYERVKELGDAMGIHISFNTYERIKDHYVPDTGFDATDRPLLL